jgi:cytochrome b
LPTRLFHWTLVAAVALAYVTSSGRPSGTSFLVHLACGYLVLLLLLFRLAWGFVGGQYARFSSFVRGPRAVLSYLAALAKHRAPRILGHNPAGGAVIILMLVVLAGIVVTGLLSEGVTGAVGPLTSFMTRQGARAIGDIHQLLGNLILIVAGIHIAGVVVESLLHHENLVAAMISGRKPSADPAAVDARSAGPYRAIGLLVLLAVVAVALAMSTSLPPTS